MEKILYSLLPVTEGLILAAAMLLLWVLYAIAGGQLREMLEGLPYIAAAAVAVCCAVFFAAEQVTAGYAGRPGADPLVFGTVLAAIDFALVTAGFRASGGKAAPETRQR